MMTEHPLLAPLVALVLWTIVMMVWMAVVRFRAVKAANIDLLASRGGRGQDLEGRLPGSSNWPAHNYTHLLEQPTIFYAIVLALVAIGVRGRYQHVAGVGLCRVADRPQHRPGDL